MGIVRLYAFPALLGFALMYFGVLERSCILIHASGN